MESFFRCFEDLQKVFICLLLLNQILFNMDPHTMMGEQSFVQAIALNPILFSFRLHCPHFEALWSDHRQAVPSQRSFLHFRKLHQQFQILHCAFAADIDGQKVYFLCAVLFVFPHLQFHGRSLASWMLFSRRVLLLWPWDSKTSRTRRWSGNKIAFPL